MSGGRATVRSVGDIAVVGACWTQLRTRGREGGVTDREGGGWEAEGERGNYADMAMVGRRVAAE